MTTSVVMRKDLYFDRVGYRPHEGQQAIHYDPTRFRVVSNGRRWGKTLMGGKEVEPNAFVPCWVTGEGQLGWIVGPQYTDAEKEFRVVYDSLRRLGVDKDCIKFQKNTDSGALHIITNWGFELVGKSARHPETLVGEGLNFVLMVEAGRHRRKTWGEYIRPALSDKRGWALLAGVPEGRSEHSLLYALWQVGQNRNRPTWKSWRMQSWTNTVTFPGGINDPEIMDAREDLTDSEFRRQYGAEFAEKVGAVMQEWDDETHLKDLAYDSSLPLYAACDYGFVEPFVWLWIQVDHWNNVYVIGEERYTHRDTTEVAKDIMARYPTLVRKCVAFYPDPAEPDDTRTVERILKIQARSGTGGPLKTRLEMIRLGLKLKPEHVPDGHPDKKPSLLVDRSCQQLAWEMREGYKWPEHRSEIKSESEYPLDKDNHGPEALGRFYRGYFNTPGERGESRVTSARVRR